MPCYGATSSTSGDYTNMKILEAQLQNAICELHTGLAFDNMADFTGSYPVYI